MKRRRNVVALVALSIILAGTATAAFAYLTAQGSGTSQATTAPNAAAVTVIQSTVITGVDPGAPAQTLSGTFSNASAHAARAYVTSVSVSVSVQKAAGAPSGTCTAADYTLSNAVMPVGGEIPVGSSVGSWGGATIAFNTNPTVYQDACKGAVLTFTYTVL